jgi:periplasmic copper chaperone A
MIRSFLRAAVAASLLLSAPAFAHNGVIHNAALPVSIGSLEISAAFTRATLPNAPVGGGFMTIVNSGAEPDRLVSATSPAAGEVQLHEMGMEGDVMKMRHLPDGIEIPAGETVTLAPGGLHIMLMGLKQAFVEGETIPLTLTFEKAGTVEIELVVGEAAAKSADHSMTPDHSTH